MMSGPQRMARSGNFVFQDKIWVAGGAAEPDYQLDSEVWSLYVPENWFSEK